MKPKDFENKMTTDSGEDFVRCLNCGAVIENQLIFKNNLPYPFENLLSRGGSKKRLTSIYITKHHSRKSL